MKDKLRSVNTRFWDDPFIEDLPPSEKLLFLYLLTNPLTSLLGIYEITIKRICYDTGLNKEAVSKAFERFGMVGKAFFVENYIILPNWLKNQKLNTNMKVAVKREFDELPNELKTLILNNDSESLHNHSESFEMIVECLGKGKGKLKGKYEGEEEAEILVEDVDFEKLKEYYNTKCSELPTCKVLTKARIKAINARIREYSKDEVKEVIEKTAKSQFLTGKNKEGWKANIDWIFNPNNFAKILEGNYDSQPQRKEEHIPKYPRLEEVYAGVELKKL